MSATILVSPGGGQTPMKVTTILEADVTTTNAVDERAFVNYHINAIRGLGYDPTLAIESNFRREAFFIKAAVPADVKCVLVDVASNTMRIVPCYQSPPVVTGDPGLGDAGVAACIHEYQAAAPDTMSTE